MLLTPEVLNVQLFPAVIILYTVNFGYNDVSLGKKKKVAIREVSLYPKYTNYGIMHTCMYGCRILCKFYIHDMTYMYHTFVHNLPAHM